MPTLPLYAPNAAPDAAHQIISPGGYEHWTVAAEGDADTQINATFAIGYAFHPAYLRADARYRRRPTRVAPAVPADFSCVSLAVYVGGHRTHGSVTRFPASSVSAAADRLDLRIGPNSLRREEDGRIRLFVRGSRGQSGENGVSLNLDLMPRQSLAPVERRWMRCGIGGHHSRVVADTFCDVVGSFETIGGGGTLPFKGRSVCDHCYGTAPLARELDWWFRGAAAFEDGACAFQIARPRSASSRDDVHVVRGGAAGVQELRDMQMTHGGWRRAGLLSYPTELTIGTGLRLSRPRVIDRSWFVLRLRYVATNNAGRETSAYCEIVHPRRLCWPVAGRLIERSIRRADA